MNQDAFIAKQTGKLTSLLNSLYTLDKLWAKKRGKYDSAVLLFQDSITTSVVVLLNSLLGEGKHTLLNNPTVSDSAEIKDMVKSLIKLWNKSEHKKFRDKVVCHFVKNSDNETFQYMTDLGRKEVEAFISTLNEIIFKITQNKKDKWVTNWSDVDQSVTYLIDDV